VDCVMQRGKIKAARLRPEAFTLSAVSDEVSSNLDEVLTVLQGAGINHVELRRLGDKEIIDLSPAEAKEVKRKLMAKKFTVSAFDAGVNRIPMQGNMEDNGKRFTRALDMAALFETRQLIVSSFQVPADEEDRVREQVLGQMRDMAALAGKRSITLLLENVPGAYGAGSRGCEDLMRTVNSPWLKLAFNPVNFVRTGAQPFLGIFSHIRKYIGQLYINDAVFSGVAQPAGYGNAEVKELMSILRCRSFNGCFTIKHGLGEGPALFREAVGRFWQLLDAM